MKKKAHDPIVVALVLFILLFISLIMYLASAAVDKRAAEIHSAQRPWSPPGWVGPTTPPPANIH